MERQTTKTTVINLYGGPSSGKSTLMAGIFYSLRCLGYNIEMCPEWIKWSVFKRDSYSFKHQEYIFAQQLSQLKCIAEYGVPLIVTDAPILLSLIYGKTFDSPLAQLIKEQYEHFENIDIFVQRAFPYRISSRVHTEAIAKEIDTKCIDLLQSGIVKQWDEVKGDQQGLAESVKLIRTLYREGKGRC